MLRLGDLQPAHVNMRGHGSVSVIWRFDNNYGVRVVRADLIVNCSIIAWSEDPRAGWVTAGDWRSSVTAAELTDLLDYTAALAPYHSNLVY